MQELANIFIKSIFIDNMVFAYFLGMCSYLAVSKTVKTSVGMGFAVVFVLGITIPIFATYCSKLCDFRRITFYARKSIHYNY
jgi:Na+-transporting NADH:ubiquinone oxidoreductase subunit NqrE